MQDTNHDRTRNEHRFIPPRYEAISYNHPQIYRIDYGNFAVLSSVSWVLWSSSCWIIFNANASLHGQQNQRVHTVWRFALEIGNDGELYFLSRLRFVFYLSPFLCYHPCRFVMSVYYMNTELNVKRITNQFSHPRGGERPNRFKPTSVGSNIPFSSLEPTKPDDDFFSSRLIACSTGHQS